MVGLLGETIAPMSQRRSRSAPWGLAVAVVIGAVLVLGGFFAVRAHSRDTVDPSASASAASALEALLAAPAATGAGASSDPARSRDLILSKKTLADAIAVARPLMVNTVGRVDTGSALFALWASRGLTWEALDALPETTPALFRKDPDSERGRRLCISGTILEIRAEKTLAERVLDDRPRPLVVRAPVESPSLPMPELPAASASAGAPEILEPTIDFSIPSDGKVYVATIRAKVEEPAGAHPASEKDALVAEVIAVKSTGALVDGSEARACGVLTGVTLPPSDAANSLGDVTEHRIVGMFDLPENHGS